MKFTAKVQERKKYGSKGVTPWTQKWIFLPKKLEVEKGDKVEVRIKEEGVEKK